MSGLTIGLLVAGAGIGAGVWLFVAAWVPSRPDLAALLTAPRRVGLPTYQVKVAKPNLQQRLEARLGRLHISTPDADLAAAGLSRGRYLLIRVGLVLLCLLLGQLYTALIWALDLPVSVAFPQIVFLILAVLVWVGVRLWVKDRAAARRREMRYALLTYLRRVLARRAMGLDMGSALSQSAAGTRTWTFQLIASRISMAARAGRSPWAALADLADELGIRDLADLASISQSAGEVGAGVYTTLRARITALGKELQKNEEALAAASTMKLALPRVFLVLISIGYMAYPAVVQLMSA